MSNRMPSLAALLGLVAIAGYQNRERIGDFLKGLQSPNRPSTAPGAPASPAHPEQPTDMAGSGYAGSSILGGLGELLTQFRNAGQGQKAESWVASGRNEPVNEQEMEQALGPEMLAQLSRQTGLDPQELLRRLAQTLPEAVDSLTPEGRIPSAPLGGSP